MKSGQGVFIVLEGIDGSGTTTQVERLVTRLRAEGRQAVGTREPSGGPIGRLLREILLGEHRMPGGTPVVGDAMALLFAADRRDHLAREVEPALAAGAIVVSDRYLLSSFAYQMEETDKGWVRALARALRQPEVTLLLDLPVATAAQRRAAAGRPVERYDADSFLARVAANYRALAASEPGVRLIEGSGTQDEVEAAIWRETQQFLPPR